MSGVEAAGLALAVFPLLVTALEHYRESAEMLGDWWKFKRKYTKCKRDIEYHQLTFTANLEELLLPLIADDEELEELVREPGGSRWSDPELDARLRERLPNSYDAYRDSINEINGIMDDLKKELGLDNASIQERVASTPDDTKTKGRSSKDSLSYQGKRIRFALGQSTREKLLDEFSKYNGRLRDLLRTGDKMSAIKRAHIPKSAVLLNFWKHAKALYALLFESWRCDCRGDHHANLLLCHRTPASSIDFQLLLLFARDWLNKKSLNWRWQEAFVKFAEKKDSKESKGKSNGSPYATNTARPKSAQLIRPSILSRSKVRSVISMSSSTMTLTASRTNSPSIVGVRWTDTQDTLVEPPTQLSFEEEKVKDDTPPMIKDLCGELCKGIVENGALADEHSDNYYTMQTREYKSTGDLVPLYDLLRGTSTVSFPRRKRYHLAFILASSQAQLHSTQWLQNEWRKTDIVFTEQDGALALDKPHISRDFCQHKQAVGEQDHSVATLGILLLELCFGSLLEDQPLRRRLPTMDGPQNFFLDLAAALEWSGQVVDEAGPAYAGAVKWCLSQHSVPADEKWRAELVENVVKPLQECHGHLNVI